MRDLVEQLAAATLTEDELRVRGEVARRYLRDEMGIEVTDEAMAASARLRAMIAERGAVA